MLESFTQFCRWIKTTGLEGIELMKNTENFTYIEAKDLSTPIKGRRIKNKDIGEKIKNREEFRASSTWAKWTEDRKRYEVYSYETLMAYIDYDGASRGEMWRNEKKYSVTTSQVQWTIKLAFQEMEEVAR